MITDRHHVPLGARAQVLLSTVTVLEEDLSLQIGFARCFGMHLGLRLRDQEGQRCLLQSFAGSPARWSETERQLVVATEEADAVRYRLPDVAEALARIAWRPLTPRLVVAALDISNQERLRWTKDGRLPSSGSAQLKRQTTISIPTYAVSFIERLLCEPATLAAWRANDAGAPSRGEFSRTDRD